MNETRFKAILKKLELLKKYDEKLALFGAKEHQYRLNPALSEEEIANFESKENIKLPKAYRHYLKHVANGGAGPSYGIYPLDVARNGAGFHPPVEDLKKGADSEHSPGELLVCHHGCGLFTWLKVTGPLAGELWYDGRTNDSGVGLSSKDFLEWYESWLNSAFLEKGFISHLGMEALKLGQESKFNEALELFELGVKITPKDDQKWKPEVYQEYLKLLCNSLYFAQNDNTKLPVNKELNHLFLDQAMKYAKENPDIYFNAAAVYNEMKEFDKVFNCIKLAKKNYSGYDMMMQVIATEPVFEEFRQDDRYKNFAG